jgi:hypothetical protein
MKPRFSAKTKAGAMFTGAPMAFDARQRAMVKMHYFNHAAGGGAALKAHTRYVARDTAARDDQPAATPTEEKSEARETAPEGVYFSSLIHASTILLHCWSMWRRCGSYSALL